MKKQLFIPASIILLLLYIAGCVKPTKTLPPAKFTGCRITQIKQYGQDSESRVLTSFFYNDDGTVQRIYSVTPMYQYNAANKYFTYKDNYIKIRTIPLGQTVAVSTDSLVLDSKNRVSFIYHNNNSYGSNTAWESYQYDSSGNMILHTSSQYYPEATDTFIWSNGDVVRLNTDNSTSSGSNYVYTYSDTLSNTGNITARPDDFIKYGRAIYTNKHLANHETCISCYIDVMTYAYITDSAGKLSYEKDIPLNGGDVNLKNTFITYSCE